MANSIFKVHEMINKVGFEFDDVTAKKVTQLAEKAGQLAADNMTAELSGVVSEIGDIFNQALSRLGKQQIDITDMLKMPDSSTIGRLTSSFVSQIADNIADGISNGVNQGVAQSGKVINNITQQLNALQKRKDELNAQTARLDKQLEKYERLSDISSMDFDEFKPLKLEDDIDEQAERIMSEFTQAEDALSEATRGTKEYNKALITALQAANNLYRMSQTISQNKSKVKDRSWIEEYKPINLSDLTSELFEISDVDFNKYLRGFTTHYKKQVDSITAELHEIDMQIDAINQNASADFINQEKAKSAIKTLEEIEAAYERLAYKSGKTKGQLKPKNQDKISSALEYAPGAETLTTLKNDYMEADPEKWEQQYIVLVKFVKEYKAYLEMLNKETDSHQRSKMKERLKSYTALYEQLSPMAENAENMLRNVLNVANNVSLVGMGEDANNVTTSISSDEVINAEKVAEAENLSAEAIAKQNAEQVATLQTAKEKLAITEQEKAVLLEQIELLKQMRTGANEHGVFYDSKTGSHSQVQTGDKSNITSTFREWQDASLLYDTRMHSHPNDVAAPSVDDFTGWIKGFDYFKKQMIVANKEILSFDFSSLSRDTLQSIATTYQKSVEKINAEFDKIRIDRKIGEQFGTLDKFEEALQLRLRQSLEQIMQQYPNVMESYKIPDSSASEIVHNTSSGTGDASSTEVKTAQEEAKRLRKEKEALAIEKDTLQSDLNVANEQIKLAQDGQAQAENEVLRKNQIIHDLQGDLEYAQNNELSARYELQNEINASLEKDDIIQSLKNQLSQMVTAASVEDNSNSKEQQGVVISEEQLKSILSSITYSVKIASNEQDTNIDEIPIDEPTLKRVLESVTFSIKNLPDNSQQSANYTQGPWALEETLKNKTNKTLGETKTIIDGVRGILGGIKKQLPVKIATDGTLTQIKNVLSTINGKIVQGTKVVTPNPNSTPSTPNVVFNEKINTQMSSLALLYDKLDDAKLLTHEVEQQWIALWNILNQAKTPEDLQIFHQRLTQLKIDIEDIARKNKILSSESKDSFQQLMSITKLYNQMMIGEQKATTPESKAYYKQVADDMLVEQQTLLQAITLTAEQQAKFDALELERARKINEIKANQKGAVNAQHNAQVEAETVKRLIVLYESLGKARYKGEDTTSIRAQIKTERATLSSIDYATDMKFKGATDKGYNAEKTKAENVHLREQKDIVNKLIPLYERLGVLKERIGDTSGSNEADAIQMDIDNVEQNIQALESKLDVVTPELRTRFTEAQTKGKNTESLRQYNALGIAMDKEELDDISKLGKHYEKLAKLRAELSMTPNGEHSEWLKGQIKQTQLLIKAERQRLQVSKEQLNEFGRNANKVYHDEKSKLEKKAAQNRDKEAERERKKQDKLDLQRQRKNAMMDKANSAFNRGRSTYLNALSMDNFDDLPEDFSNKINKYIQDLEQLENTQYRLNNTDIIEDQDKQDLIDQTINVNKLTNEINELLSEYQRLSGDHVTKLGLDTLGDGATLEQYKKQLTDAVMAATNGRASIKGFDEETKTLTYTVKTGSHEFTEYTATVRNLDHQMVALGGNVKKTESFLEASKRKFKEISSYISVMAIFSRVSQELRRGIQYVREIDSALTELRKVTDETEESYDKFLDTAAKTANKVGSTVKEIISSTADWARLGYSISDAAQLAETTSVLLNVSEFQSIDEATSALTSTLQAFSMTAEQSMSAVDVLNEIGNNFAVSSDGIATALQDSASSLVAANNSYQEAVALIAAANRVVQDPNSVGSALRTISLRLRGTSVKELEEAGEDTTGAVESTSKLRSKVQSLTGIDILTNTGAYKSTYEILLDISKVWDKLTDMDRAATLELLAGKNRANTLAAILSNTKDLESAYQSAMTAEGSAMAENEKYLESIQGRIDLFNNSLQTMWNNALDSEVVKDIVNLGTLLIEAVDNVGLLQIAFIGLGTYLMQKFKLGDALNGLFDSKAFNQAKERLDLEDELDAAIQKYNEGLELLSGSERDGSQALEAYQEIDELEKKIKENGMSIDDAKNKMELFGNTTNSVGKKGIEAWGKLKTGAKAFGKAALEAGKSMLVMYAITSALELLAKGTQWLIERISGLKDSPEKAQEKFEELNNELSSTTSELNSLESELNSTNDRIEELLQQDSLSFVEQEELDNLRSVSSELERQIGLTETLQKQQQQTVNVAAFDASSAYSTGTSFYSDSSKTERQEEAKAQGELIGEIAGGAAGAALAAKFGAAGTVFGGPMGTLVGMGLGMLIGSFAGGAIGSASEGSSYDTEMTVGEAVDRMSSMRAGLEADIDAAREAITNSGEATKEQKEALQDAEKALADFDTNMAQHIGQMQQWLNAIDYASLTKEEDKQKYRDIMDDVLAYNIEYGLSGAKTTAIETIFNEKMITDDAQALMDAVKVKLKNNEDIDFMDFNGEEFDGIKERLDGVGLTVTDVIGYFRELSKVEEVASNMYETSEILSSVSSLSEGVEALKQAFDEFNESGLITAETLIKLNELFGNLDGWSNYIDIVSSGVASTQEVIDATNELTEDLVMGIVDRPFKFVDDETTTDVDERTLAYQKYITMINQLQHLGVSNAKELVDAMQQKAVAKTVADEIALYEELNRKKEEGTATETELEQLATLGNKTAEERIKLAEEQYGIELKNTGIIKDQVELIDVQNDLSDLKDYEADFIGDSTLLDQYESSASRFVAGSSWAKDVDQLYDQASKLRDEGYYESDGTWTEAKDAALEALEVMSFGLIESETGYDELDDIEQQIKDKNAEFDKAKEEREEMFERMLEFAETEGIDLSDINIDEFDPTTFGDGSIFNQVFNKLQPYYEEKKAELEALEKELKEKLDTAFDEIGLEVILELQDKSKLIDDIQSVYDALANAQKEYEEGGYLSVDTMQDLLGLEPKYLALLYDENNQLNLNEEALYRVAEARIIDMGLAQQKAILEQGLELATNGSKDALLEYTEAMYGAAEASEEFAQSQMTAIWAALQARTQSRTQTQEVEKTGLFGIKYKVSETVTVDPDLTPEEAKKIYGDIVNQYNSVQSTIDQGLAGVRKGGLSNSGDGSTESVLDDLTKRYERQIKNLEGQQTYIENEIEKLEAEDKTVSKSLYEQQIGLEERKIALYQQERAELLKLERTDEVADRLWEVEHAIQESAISISNMRQNIIDLYKTAFDDIIGAYGNKDDFFSDQQNYIDKYMELMELQGNTKTAGGFQEQIDIENQKLQDNQKELQNLIDIRDTALASGYLKEGSEEWIDMEDNIRATEEAILDNKIAIEEYRNELKQLSVDAFDLVRNAFSNKDNFLTKQQDYIEGYADLLEGLGVDIPDEIYEKLIDIEQQKREDNVANLVNARNQFAEIEAAGYTAADEEWHDAYNQVTDLEKAILDNDIAMAQWVKTIRDADFEKFERLIDRLDDIDSERDNLRDIFSDEDVASEDGEWTKDGITSLGLLYDQMVRAQNRSGLYGKEIEKLNEEYKKGSMSEQEYYERLQTLKDGQWDAIGVYEDAKDAIIDMEEARIDMIEEGINKEIEAYQELIDVKKEELDAERDLYEFKKDVEEQTKNIGKLQRRIASLSGSDDMADIAERRRLEEELRDAQGNLSDTYYSHTRDQQAKVLDDEMTAFEEAKNNYLEMLKETLDDTEQIISEKIAEVLVNADTVLNNMNTTASEYGVTLSDNLKQPWINAATQATSFKDTTEIDISSLISEEGIITLFNTNATQMLVGVFGSGSAAANGFNGKVSEVITVVQGIVNASTSPLTANLRYPWDTLTSADGPINTFSSKAQSAINGAVNIAKNKASEMTNNLASPWRTASNAINIFSNNVVTALNGAITKINEYNNSAGNMTTPNYTGNGSGGDGGYTGGLGSSDEVKVLQKILNTAFGTNLDVDGSFGPATKAALKNAQQTMKSYLSSRGYATSSLTISGEFDSATRDAMKQYFSENIFYYGSTGRPGDMQKFLDANELLTNQKYKRDSSGNYVISPYAKGTLGTKQDEWAITDEPMYGDELTLVPGKDGNLSFMRKGTGVVPADMTKRLFELAQMSDGELMSHNIIKAVVPNISNNTQAVHVNFETLVKADNITNDVLPEVEKMVSKQLESFTRQLNYSLKKFK